MRSYLILVFTMSMACKVDSGTSEYCTRSTSLSGEVDAVPIASENYSTQVAWFNRSAEEQALSGVDEEMMEDLGLDKDNQEDVVRYQYWLSAYDLRLLLIEELSETPLGSLGAKLGKDFSVFFFDLGSTTTQPDVSVSVFSLADIQAARTDGDKDALGDAIRDAVDTMRDNGKADVIIGFAPDRSEESQPEGSLINLFSPNTLFAIRGQAQFKDLVDRNGDGIKSLTYPVQSIDATSVSVDATFAGGTAEVEATCVGTAISG